MGAMPKKKTQSARKGGVVLPTVATSRCDSNYERDLARAIQASQACALQVDTYESALEKAVGMSCAAAEAEANEAEHLRLALELSLADAQKRNIGLGLKPSRKYEPEARDIPQQPACRMSFLHAGIAVGNSTSVPLYDANASAACSPEVSKVPHKHLLKVTHNDDTRRLQVEWMACASAAEVLARIQQAIEDGFELPHAFAVPPAYGLKYRDDEGDLCTLVEDTVADFLTMALHGSSLKVSLVKLPRNEQVDAAQEVMGGISIATPPLSPRGIVTESFSTIEDDYSSAWSIV